MVNSNLPNILKERRLQLSLSQQGLAERLGVTKALISMYETGKRAPSREMITKLSEVLNISADVLLHKTPNNVLRQNTAEFHCETVIPSFKDIQSLIDDKTMDYVTFNNLFPNAETYSYFDPESEVPPMIIDKNIKPESNGLLLVTNGTSVQVVSSNELRSMTDMAIIGRVICIFCSR